MHFVFKGGSELQRRWFVEAARSLEGETTWAEVWSHSEHRDWLPVIEGYPILELPMLVIVTWEQDPEPSVHNEWAYTENMRTALEGPVSQSIAGVQTGPWLGPLYFGDHPIGGDDWSDSPFGVLGDLVFGAYQFVGPTEWPTSKVQLLHNLDTKGEEIYKYVVRHELGHVLMNDITTTAVRFISEIFGLNFPNDDAAWEWFVGEGKPWAEKGKEAIAETVADLFWLGPTRGPGRYSFNRAKWKLKEFDAFGNSNARRFISELAPRLGGFNAIPPPAPHPVHPYAQNAANPPTSSTRDWDYPGDFTATVAFAWSNEGIDTWAEQWAGDPPPEPELWRADLFATPAFYFTTDPAAAAADPFVMEVNPVSVPRGAATELYLDVIAVPGGISTLLFTWLVDNTFFDQRVFTGIIDELGIPHYNPSAGQLSIEVTDAGGRPCWLPVISQIGSDDFRIARRHIFGGAHEEEFTSTFLDGDGEPMPFPEGFLVSPFGYLHDPRIPLEPVLAGTSLDPETAGLPVYKVRPDCSTIELPLKVRMAASSGGSVGEVSAGAGGDISTPIVTIDIVKETANNHKSPPAFVPPWPYVGNIKALPAAPGTRPRKPTVGAPAGALVLS